MTYVSTDDVDKAVKVAVDGVVGPNVGHIPDAVKENIANGLKDVISRFFGIDATDGIERIYDVITVEDENTRRDM